MWEIFRKYTQIKASLGQHLFNNEHEYSSQSLQSYSKEGYSHNPTVFACIDLGAKAFGSIPLKVKVNGERVEGHPLEKLLQQPNPDEGGVEFRIAAYSWRKMGGNCFTEKIKGFEGISQLWNWQPYQMSVGRQKGDPMPRAYQFGKGSGDARTWMVDVITGKSDMLHWRTFNPDPESPSMGMSPLQAGASSVDQSNAAAKWNYNLFKNKAKVSGILSSDGEGNDPTNMKEIRESVKNKQGSDNAHDVMVLSGGLKWTPMGLSPSDMDFLNGNKMLKQEICSVLNIPTQLIGLDGQTYKNYEEAKLALYTQNVMPEMDLYCSELNRWLSPDYGDNVEVYYDTEDIEALEPLRREKRAELLSTNVLTINEKRDLLSYEKRDEDEADQLFIQPNDIPLDETFADLDE